MSNKYLLFLSVTLCYGMISAQSPDDYKGTPFNGPHYVPGAFEAEDFDNGGEGISWHDATSTNQGSDYRPDTNVDIERHYNIGFTENGEWLNYTIDVKETGAYRVETYCCGPNGNGSFHLEIDGKVVTRVCHAPVVTDWADFSKAAIAENIQLTEGKHIFRWYTYGGMNVDKFVFERTGDYNENEILGNFNYPITKESSNPLFVNFDSPLYNSTGIGNLYTADPSAHVWGDRLYVYASHDMEPANGCDRMDRYHIFSTDDMKFWIDHGEILNSSQVEWGRPEGGFMWAPDCAYKEGVYYFYFPHPSGSEWNNTWKTGVATSSEPASGFTVQGYIEGMPAEIDPCVFVDEDGQAYIYNGGGGRCFGGKLKDNMMELDGEIRQMEGLVDFHEGTWVHKYNGKYYLSYADNNGNDGNQLRYAISDSPLGPWESKGIYLYPSGCYTSHGSIVEYKGKWYAFYHTSNFSGQGELRSVCFDELEYNSDGTIKPVHNWGQPFGEEMIEISSNGVIVEAENYNEGGYHVAYFKKTRDNAIYSTSREIDDVEISSDGNRDFVKDLVKGEWLRFSCNVVEPGSYDVTFTLRSKDSGSKFHLSVNGQDMTGQLPVSDNEWTEVSVKGIFFKNTAEYLDLRVDNGSIDIDNIIISSAAPYEGRPYKSHEIPGKIEAEDFDLGGEGVAYYNGTTGNQNNYTSYRKDSDGKKADIENSEGSIHLCWMNDNKWFRYSLECKEEGIYKVTARVAQQENGSGQVKLIYNGEEYISDNFEGKGWNRYETISFPDGIDISTGTQTLEMRSNMNIDWLTFEKIGNSGIDNMDSMSQVPTVFGDKECIRIKNYSESIRIYTPNGATVYEASAAPDEIKLQRGIYIVRFNQNAAKVVVK